MMSSLEKNDWKVQPDNTVQVVDPHGIETGQFEPHRNWLGIFISLGIIFSVGILVTVAAMVIIPLQVPPFNGRRLSMADLSDPKLRSASLGSQWLSDQELAFISEYDGLLLMDTVTNTTTKLIGNFTMHQIQVKEFSVSWNRRYVLLVHDVIKERLFKKTAKYTIFDLGNNHYYPLKLNNEQLGHPRYQHAQWLRKYGSSHSKKPQENLPANKKDPLLAEGTGAEITLVHQNDIYYMAKPNDIAIRLTDDGREFDVFNGVPDLLNEEILQSSTSLWPNPSGKLLAYISYNDSKVEELPVLDYQNEGIPVVLSLRYATVKSDLPEATVWIVAPNNLSSNVSKWRLLPPPPLLRSEHYVLGVGWVDDTKIWVSWMSRDQSTSLLATCEGENWLCSMVHVNHQKGGISPSIKSVMWSGNWMAFPWPIRTTYGRWYNHVALVGEKGGIHPTLTLEGCHVKQVIASHPTERKVYFLGSKLSEGTRRQHLYSVSSDEHSLRCITCLIDCPRVSSSLNDALTHAVVKCIGTHLPSMYIVNLSQPNETFPLHTQQYLREAIKDIALPSSIYKDIAISPGVHASVHIALPPGWQEGDDSFLYPLVVETLGTEEFDEKDTEHYVGWGDLLPSGRHIAHARIKLWGSDPSRYDSVRTKAIQLGKVLRVLLDQHKFLDHTQLAIWGWGSGASLALQLSSLEYPYFHCVVAVNPIMDWKQYGSYWSERLLGTLTSEGASRRYEESHLLRVLTSIDTSHMMVIQSTKDPLSHQSLQIAKSLISHGLHFRHIIYPGSTITLREERTHVYESMESFFARTECFKNFYQQV